MYLSIAANVFLIRKPKHHCQHQHPLSLIVATRPWKMVTVDILKVPLVQDYFLKWPFAHAMPDQKAEGIVQALIDNVFALVGAPNKLHSD